MNEEQMMEYKKNVDERIKQRYQEYLKGKLDLVFHGENGIPCKNHISRKIRSLKYPKKAADSMSPIARRKALEKIRKVNGNHSIELKGDFYSGCVVVEQERSTSYSKIYNIATPDGELVLKKWSYDPIHLDSQGAVLWNGVFMEFAPLDRLGRLNREYSSLYGSIKGDYSEGFIRIDGSNRGIRGWNFVSLDGKPLLDIPVYHGKVDDFHEGFAKVTVDGKVDYLDTEGNLMFGRFYIGEVGPPMDREDITFWEGDSPYEDGGDFHCGYARVKRDGKWNYIDYDGKPVLKDWYDSVSDVEFERAKVKKDGKSSYIYLGMGNYKVKRGIAGTYECSCGDDKYTVKYQPVRRYDDRYTLCTDGKNYYMFDRKNNDKKSQYRIVGKVEDVCYDEHFIYNQKKGQMMLMYNNNAIDVTEYFESELKDKKDLTISDSVHKIYSKSEFCQNNPEEIDRIMTEEKVKNLKIIEAQKRDKERMDLEAARMLAIEQEKLRQKRLEESNSMMEKAMEIRHENAKPKEERKRARVQIPFIRVDDHLEIPEDYLEKLKDIDLTFIDFTNVKIAGINFEGCNIGTLDPQIVYQKDLSGCDFTGVVMSPSADYEGVKINGCTFTTSDKPVLQIVPETFEKAICDDETTFDGKSLKGLLEERKTSHKK